MQPFYPFGYDYGNAETCGYLVEGQIKRSRIIPSAIAPGSLHDLATKRSAIGDTYERDVDALRSDEHVIEVNGIEYFVGKLALESRHASTGRGDVTRYWGDRALAMLLTISGEMLTDSTYELYVVTGLPIETFTKENREKVRDALEGDHRFTLRGKQRRAVVHVSRVVMESAGALVVYGETGDHLQGVIDIGGRTTDLYAAYGQRAASELCQGKPIGVESVADQVSGWYENLHKRPLTAREKRAVLRFYLGLEPVPMLQSYGVRVDPDTLRSWVKNAIDDVASDIVSFASTVWNSSERGAIAADISPVVIVGGGAYYFTKALKDRIPHIKVPDRPETANADGYTLLANAIMRRALATVQG